MFTKLAARLRNSDVDFRLLIPLLLSTMLVQVVTAIIRITTSYRAVELGLSPVWLGIIAAAFALLPILIAVRTGRFIDRGNDALTIWIGSGLMAIAALGFVFWSTPEGLVIVTTFMGSGHLMLMASQQMLCVRSAPSPRSREAVFGNYMVAGAIGQGLGPYVVGWAGGTATIPPTHLLFIIAFVVAFVSFLLALTLRPSAERRKISADEKPASVGTLLRIPGLLAVVISAVIMIAASDIILIYVPLLGAERSIDVKDIGLLLTVRAAASMTARLFYARLVAAAGHWPLMIASTFACAGSFGALGAPLSLPWMYVIMVVMGFSFGLATTLSITIVVDITEPRSRGTANTLRIMGNRIGQFVLPVSAGVVATATGLSGLFLMLAGAIAVSAGVMHWKRPVKPSGE